MATALCLATMVAGPVAAREDEAPSLGRVEAVSIADDAYLYGYPLVTFDVARMQQTNVAVPDAEHAPMGQMIRMRTYPAVDNHCCAAPNADTLYTEAWLDVSKEPSVLSIPDMGNRYYIMPMLDGYSEVFSVASPRTTGYKAQTYAITGPGWTGTLPPGVTQVKSATGWCGSSGASTAPARPRTTRQFTPCRTNSRSFRSAPTASPTRRRRARSIPTST